jgi:hypothetical protein
MCTELVLIVCHALAVLHFLILLFRFQSLLQQQCEGLGRASHWCGSLMDL